jgi:hypothetical protein
MGGERGMGLGTDRPRLRILDRNEGFGDIDYLQDKVLRGRQKVVERWCREHGKTQEELSIEEILEIRDLPEWQNPLGPRTKYFG